MRESERDRVSERGRERKRVSESGRERERQRIDDCVELK